MITTPATTYSVLGPLQVKRHGVTIDLGSPQHRAVLAGLLVDAGRVVPADLLAERMWPERPAGSHAGLHSCLSRLRRALEPDGRAGTWQLLRTEAPGYRLAADAHAVDALTFTQALAVARGLLDAGDPGHARNQLSGALALWRGRPYADVHLEFATIEAQRLEELRLSAVELAARADLQLGRHEELLEQLPGLVRAEPLRESLRGCLMLALYRSGRQAEALREYARLRALLVEELGADPAPQLRRLHRLILRQDPSLDLPAPAAARRATTLPPVRRRAGLQAPVRVSHRRRHSSCLAAPAS